MTSYTRNRGYPYPSSEREAGNGGLHSELLARAVAADLDLIDAGWAAELQRPTIIAGLSGNSGNLIANTAPTLNLNTVEKQVGSLLTLSGLGLVVAEGGNGWYHLTCQVHSQAVGAITADAQHRAQIDHSETLYGTITTKRMYYFESFQSGSLDMYTMGEAVVHLTVGDAVRLRFFHTNAGSDARVLQSGTRLTGTLIVLDSA